jgi:hypothetical protein
VRFTCAMSVEAVITMRAGCGAGTENGSIEIAGVGSLSSCARSSSSARAANWFLERPSAIVAVLLMLVA